MSHDKLFPTVECGHGVTRRVLAQDINLMIVEFEFQAGGIGMPHRHPHVQGTYVRLGRFQFTVGDDKFEVGVGDAFIIPSDVEHSCEALEAGVLVDSFTPRRDDFL